MEAESSLEDSYLSERQKAEEAMKAANDVRVNREHAKLPEDESKQLRDFSETARAALQAPKRL
jgi:hypothetical protein